MIVTPEEAAERLSNDRRICLDLETTGFSPWTNNIAVITLYGEQGGPLMLHYPYGRRVHQKTLRWLESFEEITCHNGTLFDILFLANAGMRWEEVRWYDTMIGEQAVQLSDRRNIRVNLQDTIKRRLGREISKDVDQTSWGETVLTPSQISYCLDDIRYLQRVRNEQEERADQDEGMRRCLDFEMSLIPVTVQMGLNGIPISMPALREYVSINAERAKSKEQYLYDELGGRFKLTSPQQLKQRLNDRFGEGLFPDTTKETLAEIALMGGEVKEVVDTVLWFKQAKRRESMYSAKWQDQYVIEHSEGDTRLHGKFWSLGTNTGRYAASQPNLQQIPKDMRSVFSVADHLRMGSTDYSAIEVRVAAALARDMKMIDAFREGRDIHKVVGAAGFGVSEEEITKPMRELAKAMSFTLLFGGGVPAFISYASQRGSKISPEQAEKAVDRFFSEFEGIARMRAKAVFQCQNNKTVNIRYPTGLRRVLFNDSLRPTVLLNNIVQGTAAAGLKYALILLRERGYLPFINAVVHDEIVYSGPVNRIEEIRDAVEIAMIQGMEQALRRGPEIPIAVESEIATSWAGDPASVHVREELINVGQ